MSFDIIFALALITLAFLYPIFKYKINKDSIAGRVQEYIEVKGWKKKEDDKTINTNIHRQIR